MSTTEVTRKNLASLKFEDQINKHWGSKTESEKKASITGTLKKLNASGQVVAHNLTIKEQAKKVYEEINAKNRGWALHVWLKIHFAMMGGEKLLGTILTHDKFHDVRLVFSGTNNITYETVDNKLFHFEGNDQDENLVYIAKTDIKILSFSNYERWTEKYKDKFRYVLELEEVDQYIAKNKKKSSEDEYSEENTHEDFTYLGGITVDDHNLTDYSPTKNEPPKIIVVDRMEYTPPALEIEIDHIEITKQVIVEVPVEVKSKEPPQPEKPKKVQPKIEHKQEKPKPVEKPQKVEIPSVFRFGEIDPRTILNNNMKIHEKMKVQLNDISTELDRLVYSDFYEFKDPYTRNFWYSLGDQTKIALAKHAHNNNMSLEAATKLFKDVKYTF